MDTAVLRVKGPTEEQYQELLDCLTECPRDVDLLIRTGFMAYEMDRPGEAFLYLSRAFEMDPSKRFLLPKLRECALPEQMGIVRKFEKRPVTFGMAMKDVFHYPFRAAGVGMLVLGTIFFYGIRLTTAFNLFPVIALVVGVLVTGYFSNWWMEICRRSAVWEDEPPDFPDPTMWTELLADWAKIVAAQIAAFLPMIALTIYLFASGMIDLEAGPEAIAAWDPGQIVLVGAALVVFGLFGLAYYPMALMANALLHTWTAAFNPFFVIRSIARIPAAYLAVVGVSAAIWIAAFVTEALIEAQGIVLVGGILITFVEMYVMVVQMRMLGLLFGRNQGRLGWFV